MRSRLVKFLRLNAAVPAQSARAATLVVLLLGTPVQGMTFKRLGNTLILSGEVIAQDLEKAKAEFKSAPAITHVVLRNSMGGNSWTGYRLGELFRERGVATAVSGHCVSSCSRLFLGGKQRMFTDDYPASLTYVGFHGHYDFGKLNPHAVEKNDLARWTAKFTDGKADARLVQRWINIERRAGDVRFYPSTVQAQWKDASFLCVGTESSRPAQCERLGTNALAQGIVTTGARYSSPDSADLPYKQREARYPTTAYATLHDDAKLPIESGAARKDYQLFRASAVPRAFAVSINRRHWGWSGNDSESVARAIERCQARARATCVLYAVDERVVFVKP